MKGFTNPSQTQGNGHQVKGKALNALNGIWPHLMMYSPFDQITGDQSQVKSCWSCNEGQRVMSGVMLESNFMECNLP